MARRCPSTHAVSDQPRSNGNRNKVFVVSVPERSHGLTGYGQGARRAEPVAISQQQETRQD